MGRPSGSKNKISDFKTAEINTAVKDLSLEGVSNKLASTQVEITKQLAGLSATLSERLGMLDTIDAAIHLRKEELQTLRNIEVTATSLDDLESNIQAQRDLWEKERQLHEVSVRERDTERVKQLQRTEEEYKYKTVQEQAKIQDAFNTRMALQDKASKDKQELLEKTWSVRESELKLRENELAGLRKQVEEFPLIVKKEVDSHVAQATNSLKREYETKLTLLNKDIESNQKLGVQEIKSLTDTIAKLNTQVLDLQKQLSQAHNDVKEISAKALESSAARETVSNLQKAFESVQGNRSSK